MSVRESGSESPREQPRARSPPLADLEMRRLRGDGWICLLVSGLGQSLCLLFMLFHQNKMQFM